MSVIGFRLAQSGDFNTVVRLSEGIYNGHDYLPFKFHRWLQRDNLAVVLAYSGGTLVGLQACFVVDEGPGHLSLEQNEYCPSFEVKVLYDN